MTHTPRLMTTGRQDPFPRSRAGGPIACRQVAAKLPLRDAVQPLTNSPAARWSPAMTVRDIALLGQPVLLTPSVAVEDPLAPEVQLLIDDMLETIRDADGIGLAAPQVGVGRRVIVAMELATRDERREAPVQVLINPELVPIAGASEEEPAMAFEGCLLIPDLRGLVPRHRRVGYRALDRHGLPMTGE